MRISRKFGQRDEMSGHPPTPGDVRVRDLTRRYRKHPAAAPTLWTDNFVSDGIEPASYRGSNVYVWQEQSEGQLIATYDYLRSHDKSDWLDLLGEDGSWGAEVVEHDNRLLSRDLLDSVSELIFLADVLDLGIDSEFSVLDIGAGYGRFAQRCTEVFPRAVVSCTDGVAYSTALSEFHLEQYDRTAVVPLDELQSVSAGTIDVVSTMHCFNEIPLKSVNAWIAEIVRISPSYLFMVPNDTMWMNAREDGWEVSFEEKLIEAGLTLVSARHKYHRSAELQQHGLFPETYALFSLDG